MTNFKFHKLNEKEKKQIEKETKKIINSFSKKLEKIKDLPEQGEIEREECSRKEYETKKENCKKLELKKRILENAPNKNKDFILAKEKKW
jgi:hypothetical protein